MRSLAAASAAERLQSHASSCCSSSQPTTLGASAPLPGTTTHEEREQMRIPARYNKRRLGELLDDAAAIEVVEQQLQRLLPTSTSSPRSSRSARRTSCTQGDEPSGSAHEGAPGGEHTAVDVQVGRARDGDARRRGKQSRRVSGRRRRGGKVLGDAAERLHIRGFFFSIEFRVEGTAEENGGSSSFFLHCVHRSSSCAGCQDRRGRGGGQEEVEEGCGGSAATAGRPLMPLIFTLASRTSAYKNKRAWQAAPRMARSHLQPEVHASVIQFCFISHGIQVLFVKKE